MDFGVGRIYGAGSGCGVRGSGVEVKLVPQSGVMVAAVVGANFPGCCWCGFGKGGAQQRREVEFLGVVGSAICGRAGSY